VELDGLVELREPARLQARDGLGRLVLALAVDLLAVLQEATAVLRQG
jgi:hypothetical protein